ncbi:MAG: DUF3131 domain-containing protein [Paracoccaceae bacterium]
MAILILQDLPEKWNTVDTTNVLEHFWQKKLAVTLIQSNISSIFEIESYTRKRSNVGYGSEDHLEVVSIYQPHTKPQRFWHLRDAFDLRERVLADAIRESSTYPTSFPITYFERSDGPPSDLNAFRSAGFRIRITRPQESGPVEISPAGLDQLSIAGGTLLDLFDPEFETALAGITRSRTNGLVLHLSLGSGAGLDTAELAIATETAVQQIDDMLRRTGYWTLLPRELFLLGSDQVPRDIAILLDATHGDRGIDALAKALAERNLPFSRIANDADGPDDCVADLVANTARLAGCLVTTDPSVANESAATVLVGAPRGNGLAADIRMRLGLLGADSAARLNNLTLAESDRVLHLRSQEVAKPSDRARLLRWFVDAQNLGVVRFHDVPGLRDRVMASDPVIRRYWSVRRRRLSDPPSAATPVQAERTQLLDDAALAWSYFERFVYPDTGLAAGTVAGGSSGRINSEITLWDVASQINATRAAAALGFISPEEAGGALKKLLSSLPTNRLGGGRLPPSNFSALTLKTTVAGFDSCDAGRFGIALARAVEKGLIEKEDVQTALKSWTLEQAIHEGRNFTNRDGRWQDTSQSHCTDYAVPGFAFLGHKVDPLFDWPGDGAETEISVLYKAAAVGAISTEPYALRAIETGHNGPARLILDVLFDAQLAWFEKTGEIRCISEAPINRAPWFIYSGLRIDLDNSDAWVIGTIMRDAEFSSDEFRGANELISSKAAYLWKAVYPHRYSDQLVEIIRDKARIPGLGFSVGVFTATQEPMQNYTDINTNGIILSAVAHILGEV